MTRPLAPLASAQRALRRVPVAGRALARLPHVVVVLVLVSFGTFMLVHLTPGDPAVAILGTSATPKAVAELDHQLGLDQPVLSQYGHWLGHAVSGNLGTALVSPGGPVTSRIAEALPISLELAVFALLLALLVAIPASVLAAYRPGGRFDRGFSATSFGFLSVPPFVIGLLFALVLTLSVHAFPRTGWVALSSDVPGNLWHAFLPALTLALPLVAYFSRVLRAELVQTLSEDYILFARSRGLPVSTVLFRYALRPSSVGLVTVSGVALGTLLGGTVIVETIFALPGLGNLLVTAVDNSDYPLIQGVVLVIAVAYVVINLVVDLSYGLFDPRLRQVGA